MRALFPVILRRETKLIERLFFSTGTSEQQCQLFERPPWQKLVSVFLAELIGTAILMLFGCMGLVPTLPGGELGPYSGAIAFSGIVAVVIVVSILHNLMSTFTKCKFV